MMDKTDRCWHALYVRSRAEKKVLAQLEDKGIQAYLPLIAQVKQWSDRRKKVEEPLFTDKYTSASASLISPKEIPFLSRNISMSSAGERFGFSFLLLITSSRLATNAIILCTYYNCSTL